MNLPWDIMASTLITLGSGQPYNLVDVSRGWDQGVKFRLNAAEPQRHNFILPNFWAFRQVDLRFSKDFQLPNGDELGVILDVINAFNFANYGYGEWSSGFIPPAGETNPNFGKPERIIGPMRSFQVGLRYRW